MGNARVKAKDTRNKSSVKEAEHFGKVEYEARALARAAKAFIQVGSNMRSASGGSAVKIMRWTNRCAEL